MTNTQPKDLAKYQDALWRAVALGHDSVVFMEPDAGLFLEIDRSGSWVWRAPYGITPVPSTRELYCTPLWEGETRALPAQFMDGGYRRSERHSLHVHVGCLRRR